MKINFNKKLKGVDGTETEIFLKDVVSQCLLFTFKDEILGVEETKKRWKLAKLVKNSGESLNINGDDINLIQNLLVKSYKIHIAASALDALE